MAQAKAFSTKVELNHTEYEFSHGKRACGFGYWAFKVSGVSEVLFFTGTLTDCKRLLAEKVKAPKGVTVRAKVLP